MTKERDALTLALEAMRFALHVGFDESSESQIKKGDKAVQQHQNAITAIREALAENALDRMAENARELGLDYETAQEPVAYSYTSRITGAQGFSHHPMPRFTDADSWDIKPLYTSPQPAQPSKPLTDEEIWDEVKAADLDWQTGWSLDEDASNRYITFARAIEAAHGIKEKRND